MEEESRQGAERQETVVHQGTTIDSDLAHQQKAEHYMRLLELWAAELTLAVNEGREQPNNQERLNKCATSINGGLVLLRMHLELKNIEDIIPIRTSEQGEKES